MNIQNNPLTAEFQPEIIGKLDATSGRLASAIFKVNGWPPMNATSADLRNIAVPITSLVDRRRAEDDPFGVRIEEIRDDGKAAIANGHCFDLGKVANTADLLHRQPDPALLPMLVVPYETTPISIVFGSEPWLFILKSDDRGRLVDILILTLVEDERRRWPFVVAKALISVHRLDDGEPAPIIHVDADHREQRQIHGYLWLTWTLLTIINDRRLALQRETTPAKLNAARLKRGKPALPDFWRLDAAAAAYVTTVTRHDSSRSRRRGGHHKPPIAHSRRAHLRRLPSGRVVFVRDCRVNEALRHLRRRDHYALDALGKQLKPHATARRDMTSMNDQERKNASTSKNGDGR